MFEKRVSTCLIINLNDGFCPFQLSFRLHSLIIIPFHFHPGFNQFLPQYHRPKKTPIIFLHLRMAFA